MGNILRVSRILQLILRAFRPVRNEENICQYCKRERAVTTYSLNAFLNQM